ncbi:hypothetical protein [Streptomyces graminofaciens]|uniref:hypothetical protein n=1 Tax=Streptomyces graminofaciens TaxID=68212 RepID=UPI002572B708|nr:hypothetical protein [Streptomyces graminofaciens]
MIRAVLRLLVLAAKAAVVTAASLTLVMGSAQEAPSEEFRSLDIRTFASRSPGATHDFVIVSLSNKTDKEFPAVVVEVWSEKQLNKCQVNKMDPMQDLVLRLSVPSGQGDMYVIARRGARDSKAIPVQTSEKQEPAKVSPPSLLTTMGPATLALIGVFIGAVLGHAFASRRESARGYFEWSKMLYERHHEAYIRFLGNWEGSPNSKILRDNFERLKSQGAIPVNILALYREVQSKLDDSSVSQEEKQKAADRLYAQVSNILSDPIATRRKRWRKMMSSR